MNKIQPSSSDFDAIPDRWASLRVSDCMHLGEVTRLWKKDGLAPSSDDGRTTFEQVARHIAQAQFSWNRSDKLCFPVNVSKLAQGCDTFASTGDQERVSLANRMIASLAQLLKRTDVPYLDARGISTLIYSLRKTIPSTSSTEYLQTMVLHLRHAYEVGDRLAPERIGMTLYGLQKHPSSRATKAVIDALLPHMQQAAQFNAESIGMALYGLQRHSSSQTTTALLEAFVPHIQRATRLGPQELSNALFGLQNHTSSRATEKLLEALVKHIQPHIPLNPQAIGNAFYGLKKHTSSQVTDKLIKALVKHIENAAQLSPQEVSNALYGLQSHTSSEATNAAINAFVPHMQQAAKLTPQQIGNALYGLQNHPSSKATEKLIEALVTHIKPPPLLDEQAIGNALYGLQNHISSEATKAVMTALVPHMQGAKQLCPQVIANALYGLQNHTSSEATIAVITALVPHMQGAKQLSPQEIGNALYGLQNHASSAVLHLILNALAPHILGAARSSVPTPTAGFFFASEVLSSLRGFLAHSASAKNGEATQACIRRLLTPHLPGNPLTYTVGKLDDAILTDLTKNKVISYGRVNLHGCSHGLARIAIHAFLTQRLGNNRLSIVCGSGAHGLNRGRMRNVAERSVHDAGWQIEDSTTNSGEFYALRPGCSR